MPTLSDSMSAIILARFSWVICLALAAALVGLPLALPAFSAAIVSSMSLRFCIRSTKSCVALTSLRTAPSLASSNSDSRRIITSSSGTALTDSSALGSVSARLTSSVSDKYFAVPLTAAAPLEIPTPPTKPATAELSLALFF